MSTLPGGRLDRVRFEWRRWAWQGEDGPVSAQFRGRRFETNRYRRRILRAMEDEARRYRPVPVKGRRRA